MYLITSTLLPTPEGTSGALLTHLSHGRLSKTVWVKYSQSWTPPPTPQRGIWGCPKGYQIGPLMKALFIHSHISIQNLPSLCPSLRIKLLWQEEPPNWGKDNFCSCGLCFREHSCSPSWWMRSCFDPGCSDPSLSLGPPFHSASPLDLALSWSKARSIPLDSLIA